MPVKLVGGKPFGTIVPSGSTITQEVSAIGNYYIIRSDKDGAVTVTATATIPKDEAKAKIDTPITGSVTFKVAVMDTKAPTATASGNVITVSDANLDTKKTTVKIHDMAGKYLSDAKMGASGVYTAAISSGTYTARVDAVDLAGNTYNITLVLSTGTAMSIEEKATAMLLAKKTYAVSGTFTSHNFGADKAKNWIYTRKSDGMSFQLLGKAPTAEDVFGWNPTEVKAGTSGAWYMIRTGEGKFDWAIANADGVSYKLKGAKSDGTFDFSGRLNLNASYKDGMLTFTAK